MEGNDRELLDRLVELFNRLLDADATPYRAELATIWADEQEIVPMRAALEGNVYRGPNAFEQFREEMKDTWAELEVEATEITGPGPRYLCEGTLRGRGRESGVELNTRMWWVVDVRDDRITRVAAHLSRDGACAEM